MRRLAIALSLLLAASSVSNAAELEFVYEPPRIVSPEEQRRQEQQRLEEQKIREEAARREQQQVDAELARRGWPKGREGEVRKYLELQKQASALKPKPGAGSLLMTSSNAQDEWAQRREDAASSGANTSASAPTNASRSDASGSSTAKKSNCWMEEKPSVVATGFSRVSEADARSISMRNTKGCKTVSEMDCSHGRQAIIKEGKLRQGPMFWDCRISYQCGETQKRCQNESAAASAQ